MSLHSTAPGGVEIDLFYSLMSDDESTRKRAAEEILRNPTTAAAPLVAEACFHFTLLKDSPKVEEMSSILRKLTNYSEGRKYFDWVRWIGSHPEIRPLEGYAALKSKVLSQIDPALGTFFANPGSFRIRIEEIVWGGVKKDGIPALINPPIISADAAKFLNDNDKVLGVNIENQYRAYPLRIMDWHEMANDELAGRRIVIPYCTLCGSAILYRASAGARTFTFGSSGLLYRSNKLMYDRETNSLWSVLAGEPVSGTLAGSGLKLEILPIVVTTWGAWRKRHPDTTVLDINTGHNRDYNIQPYKNYFSSDKNMFPVPLVDEKLKLKEFIFAVRLGNKMKAYSMDLLSKRKTLFDKIGDVRVVIAADSTGHSARAYQCGDQHPENSWRAEEDALISPDKSQKCSRIPGHIAYWFGWYAQFPETELYHP